MRLANSFHRWTRIVRDLKRNEDRFRQLERNASAALFSRYPEIAADLPYATMLARHEFRVSSQNGEDGIIAFVFSQIGTTDCRFVEFGSGDGRQCNTASLSVNFGWTGLLMDADAQKVRAAVAHYTQLGLSEAVRVRHCLVTTENINTELRESGFLGEIDLLSIDIDGNDYWVWEAIRLVQARVVVIEYNATFGRERAVAIPYSPDFNRFDAHPSGRYHGASLKALELLGRIKGYSLVGCNSDGVNAFFVRSDLLSGRLRAISSAQAYHEERKRRRIATSAEQLAAIAHLPLVTIDETGGE